LHEPLSNVSCQSRHFVTAWVSARAIAEEKYDVHQGNKAMLTAMGVI
jgi:hypothetical protein